jgi:hypothetical protein
MPATFGLTNDTGLLAPTGGIIQECSSESETNVKTIRNEAGVTVAAVTDKMVKTTHTIKGKGVGLAAVAAGTIAAGVTQITSAKSTESNEDFPEFEVTGTSYV